MQSGDSNCLYLDAVRFDDDSAQDHMWALRKPRLRCRGPEFREIRFMQSIAVQLSIIVIFTWTPLHFPGFRCTWRAAYPDGISRAW